MKNSAQLNEMIDQVQEKFEHMNDGKPIPYIGWYWRNVDFNDPVTLGDCGMFIGFMENNKWDYPEWTISKIQDAAIKAMLQVLDPDSDTIEKDIVDLYDYIQTCSPTGKSVIDIRNEAIQVVKENEAMGLSIEAMMGIPTYKRLGE